jgi:hypothetical protein
LASSTSASTASADEEGPVFGWDRTGVGGKVRDTTRKSETSAGLAPPAGELSSDMIFLFISGVQSGGTTPGDGTHDNIDCVILQQTREMTIESAFVKA